MDYPGKVIRKTPVTPSQTSASGVWTLDDAVAATKSNTWPVAGVPNPISKSLRFNSADSAYLNRTPASAGNRRTWTWSGWIKRSALSTGYILDAGTGPNTGLFIGGASDVLSFFDYTSGPTYNFELITTQSFRDVSAWYHIVVAVDTTQATSTNRVKIYLNGSQITAFGTATYPSQNFDTGWNNATAHRIGGLVSGGSFLNGYLTEVNFIDGQALTPSSFGMTDPQTGAWIPIKYTGTYGTNGFYLNFSDNSSTSALGNDYSGNGNNWTTNNFSVTAGTGNDSLTDVPTPWIAYNTTGDVGGVVRGNYCTLNPLQTTQSATAPTNGNLTSPANVGVWRRIGATIQLPTTGKWYFEYNCDSFSTFPTFNIGVFSGSIDTTNNAIGYSATEWGYNAQSGYATNNNTNITSGFTTATTGDVLQLAYDASTGSIWFGKNNTWQGASSPNPATGTSPTYTGVYNVTPVMIQNWATLSVNFGQRPFAYTPPAGFVSLCATNLPTPTIGATSTTQANKYMDISLYTGNGSSQSITNSGSFQPDFVWVKSRSGADNHNLFNAVVGLPNRLFSNLTNAENTTAGTLTSFNSNGFSVGSISDVNANAVTFVGWQWKANGAGSSNTSGTITSTVSANTTAGFSIVTYTGNGTTGATVGHGLGVKPSMMIFKGRTNSVDWVVYHTSLGATKNLKLNLTDAEATQSGQFNDTEPTSTLFTLGANSPVNANTITYVAYCFAAVAGYSAFGSYTGNGSTDGPFVYTGFRPAFVMVKRTDSIGDWFIWDKLRPAYNVINTIIEPNKSDAEATYTSIDTLSNGFKLRNTGSDINANGGTCIYAAFAEFPFKFANAR